jgi:acyl carrier protein
METIADRVRKIIAIELQIDPARIHSTSALRADLGMDSIAALNIVFAAQTEFGIDTIDEAEMASLVTVSDAEDLVYRYLPAECRP